MTVDNQPAPTDDTHAGASSKSVDDVWKERPCKQEMMTLEDFLAKAEQQEEEEEEDVKPLPSGGIFNVNLNVNVKSRPIFDTSDNKAAQQRQRRMIKNRESAARSRERKQAYQAQLESLALKLEADNHTLFKLKTEHTRKRYKQLMDNIIPVTEKQKPRRYVLRKVRSMEW